MASIGLVQVAGLDPAHAQDGHAQSQVVSAVPATYTPDVNDGTTYAINQVGTRMIIGGTFTNESNHGSTAVVSQPYLFAFDSATGVLDTGFRPVLDGIVNSIEPGPIANTVYVAGAFSTVNGVKDKSIVLLSTVTGAVVSPFKAPPNNGLGNAIRYVGGRLIVGGTFTTVAGATHDGLVSLNPTTGALDPFMNVQLTGHHNYNGSGASAGVGAAAMDVSPNGAQMVVIGNFKNANGVLHDQIVLLDLTGSSAAVNTAWNTGDYSAVCFNRAFDSYVRDVNWSPDGSYFVVVATGGSGTNTDGSRSLCDSASRWSASDTGANVQPTWVDYTGQDTFLSVAITGTAIYVGGHERWVNNPNGYDHAGAGAVPRPGLVALDPVNGLPLSWNPGRNPRGAGAYAMFASTDGLYVGSDQDYFGDYRYLHKKLGFFPLATGSAVASTATTNLPANVYEAGQLPNTNTSNVLYRIDAAGPAISAIDNGPDWTADSSDTDPGAAFRNTGSIAASYSTGIKVSSTVPSTTPSAIFNSERWSPSDNPPMSWAFPVQAGTAIEVRLYFSNHFSGSSQVGQRVFDVDLDGTRVLDHYDIVADAGDQTGTMKAFDITSDGTVNIDFHHELENPLINGIEIVRTGTTTPVSTVDDLVYRPDSGTTIGALATVPNTGIAWSSTRGAFMVGSTIFYGSTDGNFYKAGFDGKTVGTPVAIDPYDDPAWDNVQTGSGQTYQGVKSGYYAEIPNVTGAFYSDGRLYYSLLGQKTLFWRYFTPDSGIIGGTEYTVAGGNFANTAGEFLSGSTLYYANRTDGTLHTVAFTNGGTNGANPSVDASNDTVVSGPAMDGNDWRARGLFAFGRASFPDQPPTASATSTCTTLTCAFDGTGSTDPDGSVASYAWDFGDGHTATGATPVHGYAAAGTYTYTLTVTDDQGTAGPAFQGQVSVTAPTTAPVAFVAAAHSYATAATSGKVTTPTVGAGDTELLFVSASNTTANAISTPSGWTPVATQSASPVQLAVFRRTAASGDSGSVVTVGLASASQVSMQLLDYSGVGAAAVSTAGASDSATATHVAPSAMVTTAGSWVISFWSDKSSTTTGWNPPSSVTSRDANVGAGSGRVTAAIADSAAPLATGSYPSQTATVTGGPSTKGVTMSLVLSPQS